MIIKKCYCKKEFKATLWLGESKVVFEQGKYYYYYIEDDINMVYDFTNYYCAWVIYGKSQSYGLRFHQKKNENKIGELNNFYDYFENDRLKKLEKINSVERGE